MDYYLMLDVGGTSIKAGIFDHNGTLYQDEILSFDARSMAGEKEIFDNFTKILNVLTERISVSEGKVGGVGMAFPGPFDYIQGISLMKGLGKYDSIYGIRIAERMEQDFRASKNGSRMSEKCRFLFLHDIDAFVVGESRWGKTGKWNRVMYFCMGTGAGSAFTENGRILRSTDEIPENGWIYPIAFKEGIIDEYLSIRGLAKLSQKILGESRTGKELFELCSRGDEKALQVYQEFGKWLKDAIVPFLDSFKPDGFVLGGQISKSFAYFGEELQIASSERKIPIVLAEDTSRRTLEGLYIEFQEGKGC